MAAFKNWNILFQNISPTALVILFLIYWDIDVKNIIDVKDIIHIANSNF